MPKIEFTQYLLPNGRRSTVYIDRPDPIYRQAQAIIARGLRFECEILTNGLVSLTITDEDEGDLITSIVPNGPDVPDAVDRMIQRFTEMKE